MKNRLLRVGAWVATAALVLSNFAVPLAAAEETDTDTSLRILAGTVVINEARTELDVATTEFVELYNTGATSADISGWVLKNTTGIIHTFPASTTIAAGGYLSTSFTGTFADDGDKIRLENAGSALMDEILYGYAATDQISPAFSDLTIGRRADGATWYSQLSATPGVTNGGALALQAPTAVFVRAGTSNAAHVINAASDQAVTMQATVGASSTSNDFVLFDLVDMHGSIATAIATALIGAGTVFSQSIDTVTDQPLADGPIVTRVFAFGQTGIETTYSYGTMAVRDTVAPTAPLGTFIETTANNPTNVINSQTVSAVAIQINLAATAELSDTVTVSLTDGTTTVTGSRNAVSGGGIVTLLGLNATSLTNGTLTMSATSTDAAGNTSGTATPTFVVKDTNLPTVSVEINGGVTVTTSSTVTLGIPASDVGGTVTEMRVANTADFSGASFEAYASTKIWALTTGEGLRTVYVQVKDSNGNLSATVSATILVETSATNIEEVPVAAGTSTVRRLPLEATVTATGATSLTFATYTTNPGTALPTGVTGLGKYFELGTTEASQLSFPVVIKIYYTLADLAAAGIASESQLQGIAFFDQATQTWKLYSSTGVSTADITIDSQAFAGFLFANADHLTPMTAFADTTAPTAPTVSATAGNGSVALSWASVSDAASYVVRYRVNGSGSAYTTVTLTGATLTTTIVNLTNGQAYEFGVASVDAVGNVSAFTTVTATPTAPAAAQPTNRLVVFAPTAYAADGKGAGTSSGSTIKPGTGTSGENGTNGNGTTGNGDDSGNNTADNDRDLSRLLVTLAILIIAVGAGTAGYYGYQWWATRPVGSDVPPAPPITPVPTPVATPSAAPVEPPVTPPIVGAPAPITPPPAPVITPVPPATPTPEVKPAEPVTPPAAPTPASQPVTPAVTPSVTPTTPPQPSVAPPQAPPTEPPAAATPGADPTPPSGEPPQGRRW